ncbi:glycoside hydrolase family 42 [Streptacidiphilus pinicola]|uniref:Glycoside hydrolase family 42 n=1 Tax=Streptacidiphilus pinicola TaxID=2219663 RepID=A0A2X0ILJ5_9ACTN|nr:beta-galactosidase [Streptacidiphilus pinicola]RAG85517.1 glycoside hydrolase family 42 [Streptacidiphilus pinicola]
MPRTVRRGAIPLLCCALATTVFATTTAHASPTPAPDPQSKKHDGGSPSTYWATQFQFDNNGTPWTTATFAELKAKGVDRAEINMPWSKIEPSRGTFDFSELDQELAAAAAEGVKLVPIFWSSGWRGSPASWITDFEVTNTGAKGVAPAWWDLTQQQDYFTYVTTTLTHIAHSTGFGGAFMDYGHTDAQWLESSGSGGWAPADIAYFRASWLPATYGTIAAFNAKNGTTYTSFAQVPAAVPGAPLAGVYQAFREWSVQDTYDRLTAAARRITSAPLYYYFGGHISNAPQLGNLPDVFFSLARKYGVTVVEDAANSNGLSLLFGSLGRAYRVPVAQEWTVTADDSLLPAEASLWLSDYAMTLPTGGGEDFFIHDGTSKDVVGFPIFTSWLPVLQKLSGSYPTQPVAVYIDYSQARGNTGGGTLSGVENSIGALWAGHQAGFSVVTSEEIANHADSLAHYRAVLPMNGVDANLAAYQKNGGTLLTSPAQFDQAVPAYADLTSQHALQVVPATAADHRSASLTVGEVNASFGYTGSVTLHPNGLNLAPGSYHVVDALSGQVPAQALLADGSVCVPVTMGPARLDQWSLLPGAAPAGTPVPATCPVTAGGATSISATAGQTGGGVKVLSVGSTGLGADGNLTLVTQGGRAAYQTWTSAQSGVGPANLYLQLDPSSQVAKASTVTVDVTYWSVAGQGFQVQYDAPGNAYLGGPTVAGSGTGSWQTATVTLTGAQFNELQNLSADLRLSVTDPSQPLYVSNVTLSAG